MTDFRETLLVLAKSRQTKASAAKDGSQQSVVERFPNHYLWRLEWISSTLRCHLYRPEKGGWYVLLLQLIQM